MKNLMTFLVVALLTGATATFAQVQKIQNLQITGGSPGAGKILVSDAYGNVSWQTLGQVGLVISGESVLITTVVPVTSSTGKIWMDRNLGASRVAQSSVDYMAYGSLYQWGRGNDGHQLINWTSATEGYPVNGITYTKSTTDYPADNLFVIQLPDLLYNWRATQNDNLWQGVTGVNNPCPAGYRLPTHNELISEFNAYSITNIASAFASPLKFTVPGMREPSIGALHLVGERGLYWCSTVWGINVICHNFSANATSIDYIHPALGFSVRCLKG